jgi:hypothetical protein
LHGGEDRRAEPQESSDWRDFTGLGWLREIHIFSAIKWTMPEYLDVIASGIFISGGSEGFNSLMKFANYKKEASKADAGDKLKNATPGAIKAVNPQA